MQIDKIVRRKEASERGLGCHQAGIHIDEYKPARARGKVRGIGLVAWSGLRKKFRKKVEKKTMEKISRKKACELAKIGDCADKLVRLIDDSLNDTATVRQTIVKIVPSEDDEDEAEVEEYCLQKLDTKYLRQMTAAMKDLMEILRDVYGKPNTVERANMKNARERVEIEKAKAAAGIPTDDEEYGIIEIPAVLEEAAEE